MHTSSTNALLPSHWDKFLLTLGDYEEQPDGSILAHCPCPDHGHKGAGDNNPSLRAFLGDEGVIVLKCRAACPTIAVLRALKMQFTSLYPDDHTTGSPLVDEEIRAAVYESILDFLPLAPRHEKDLSSRGFTLEEIKLARYKTFTKNLRERLDLYLAERYSREDLARVPGFSEDGYLSRNEMLNGLLVPVRKPSHDGPSRIYLLKSRRSIRPKYVLWTSEHLTAEPGYHWPLFNGVSKLTSLRITEGEFKADLAALRTSIPTVSMPGIDHTKGLLDFCNGFASTLPIDAIRVTWDWADVAGKPAIRKALFLFLDHLSRAGYQPGIETWDFSPPVGTLKEVKGIDDACLCGREISHLTFTQARSRLMDLLDGSHVEGGALTGTCVAGAPSSPFLPILALPPAFPLDIFPPAIKTWITQGAKVTNTPPDYMATAAVVVAGRTLGTRVKVSIIPGWEEQANLYAAIVGPPSSTKSPALMKVLKPLKDLQEDACQEYLIKMGAHKKLVQVARSNSKSAKELAKLPLPPTQPYHYWVDDFTIEALVRNLQTNSYCPERKDMSILIYRDELSAWVGALNQYRAKGEGADREFFLSAWSGASIKVDRKSQEDGLVFLKSPFISVIGSTTPDVVCQLETKGGKADGFFPRILCCAAPPKPAFRLPVEQPTYPNEKVWDVVIKRLLLWEYPVMLSATPEAYDLLRQHYDKQADIVDAGIDQDLQAMAGKHRAYILRFSLIVHALNVALGRSATGKLSEAQGFPNHRPITSFGQLEPQDVEAASKLVDYFQAHYVHVRRYMQSGPEDRKILEFTQWVTAQGGRVEPCDLYRANLYGCRGKMDAVKLFRMAEDRGRGILELVDGEPVFFARLAPSC